MMGAPSFKQGTLTSILLLMALSVSFIAYVWAEKAIDRANEQRFLSAKLADELRHSSDDLTLMVRLFVVSGKPAYAEYFRDILDIRDGIHPRPIDYDNIYWDFVLNGEADPHKIKSGSRGEPLLERMRQAGFTEAEFAKLEEAKRNSDDLTGLEFKAMSLRRNGGAEARDEALAIVFGSDYIAAKAAIMHPIDDFQEMIEKRTRAEVDFTIRRALILRYVSIAIGLLLVLALLKNYSTLQRILGGTPDSLHQQITALGKGDFSQTIPLAPGQEDSVMGWLAETREKLLSSDQARQRAESRLRADEQKLRSLYELSPLGLALTDMQGRYIEFNEAFRRITGYETEELKQLDYWALTPRRYEMDEARQLDNLRTTGRYGPYQKEYLRKDGSLVSLCLNGMLLVGEDKQHYIWSIVEDISDRLLRERNLLRSNAELEQFAYIASHDLQTPLRNMVSYAQMLERRYKGKLDSDADDFIGFIVENGKQMSSLIHDLLQFARITQQATTLHATSARVALDSALQPLSQLMQQTGAEISIGELPEVLADENQLISLFQNLIGNALKYRHPERPPRIAVSAEPAEANFWRFSIDDNGIGIAPAYHEKIFEMFQRLSPPGQTGGTGIGLAICRRIVHRLGGEIEIAHSSPDGTSFTFTLQHP